MHHIKYKNKKNLKKTKQIQQKYGRRQ